MGVIDNELNWRKVFPNSPVDVSGWSIANRMRLPDYCFGNRQLIGAYLGNYGEGTYEYEISDIALPDPVCIWSLVIVSNPDDGGVGHIRIGLSSTVPTNEAGFDEVTDIIPYFGAPSTGPNRIIFSTPAFVLLDFPIRKGMVTGAKKLVISVYTSTGRMRLNAALIVSSLPVSVPAFLNPGLL